MNDWKIFFFLSLSVILQADKPAEAAEAAEKADSANSTPNLGVASIVYHRSPINSNYLFLAMGFKNQI